MSGWRKRQVMDMAREAGFEGCAELTWEGVICTEELEAFAELVRADEREMLAQPAPYIAVSTDRMSVDPHTGNVSIGTATQPEQKPMHPEVRKMWEDHFDKCFRDDQFDKCFRAQPPQRTWVELTDDEVYEIYGSVQEAVNEHWERGGTTLMFPSALYKAIEAKLKEKNT